MLGGGAGPGPRGETQATVAWSWGGGPSSLSSSVTKWACYMSPETRGPTTKAED